MNERALSGACKKFSANVFDKNKCQNCFKPKEVHQESTSPTSPTPPRPTSLDVGNNRQRKAVKSGTLSLATQVSTLPEIRIQKWEKVWLVLYSSGDLEWFANDSGRPGLAALGGINLDDCSGLMNAEVDTSEEFSIGIKTSLKVHYLKAENRLEMDNWCRVLKPFVIASPGYNFNMKTQSLTRGSRESKMNCPSNESKEKKSSLSRTVSAPWQTTSDQKTSPVPTSPSKKRWSASETLLIEEYCKEEAPDKSSKQMRKSPSRKEITEEVQKETIPSVETSPEPQPYYSDKYLKPETLNGNVNGETNEELEVQLAEAKKLAKHSQGKAEICSKNLTDTKKSLEKANNIISIQKANIDSLKSEVESLKAHVGRSDDKMEKRLNEIENGFPSYNGSALSGSIESGFIKLQSKLQDNEKALIRRTKELEKANESRAKVAKHTRSLLQELESKLNGNNRRIGELEEQLLNRTLDLQYEKEERQRIENEKGKLLQEMNVSKEHSKQREITKKSAELLQQAKDDHQHFKSEHKYQLKHREEINYLQNELQKKNSEVERLRRTCAEIEKKDDDMREIATAYKKANQEVADLRTKLELVNGSITKERADYYRVESRMEDISVELKQKDDELEETRTEKDELMNEIEKVKKQYDNELLLLQEDSETTRNRLQEVEDELDSLHTETDGRNSTEVDELKDSLDEWKSKLQSNKKECENLRSIQAETLKNFNNEKNKRIKLERNLENALDEVEETKKSKEELLIVREKFKKAEEKFERERIRVSELEEINKTTNESSRKIAGEKALKIDELELKVKRSDKELGDLKQKLCESEEKVVSLAEELERRLNMEQEAFGWMENVEKNLTETENNLNVSREAILSKALELDQEKTNIVDAVKLLGDHVKDLESSLKAERSKVNALEEELAKERKLVSSKCNACDKKELENSNLAQELEQRKKVHVEELEQLKESMVVEAKTLKCHTEEIKVKLTSKVILLQSDISELSSRHEQELGEASEGYKHQLETLQDKCNSLESSDEIGNLRERICEIEAELEDERKENERKINLLKSDYETKKAEEREKNGVVNVEKLDQVKEQHNQEIAELKENHQKELEENKSDMMMVLQALKSDSYPSGPRSNESHEINDELKKLERYVETLKQDHEKELHRLNEEHEQDLQQLRSDMVTLLRAQESYKTSAVDDGQSVLDSNIVDLERQLDTMRQSYEKKIREKDERHREEVEQLKSDMLVAIQAASAVGNIIPRDILSPKMTNSGDEKVQKLQEHISTMQKQFDEQRESFQNTVKKAESATKFGLRRNEEMSNKIYQMQREMEEIDTKYQKEIKLYKEAFDQEKNRKTTIGAVPGILAENESLKVKLQELELSMEQMQVRYDSEIKRYKEKFQQGNVLTVEELQLKIKSLEDSSEQMRLEHDDELQRYTKAVKRGKVSLAGTVKERDLERKIDDLESKVEMMRQKHREEIRKYRERLEDEMERHRKEISDGRSKVRKLEMDNRQLEEFKNKIVELENKTAKLTKETNKTKEQELELTETKTKNRELHRQVENFKRRIEKLEEANEESKESKEKEISTVVEGANARKKLSRYSSCDNVTLNSAATRNKSQGNNAGNENSGCQEDVFEPNNNSTKSEIGGYKLNALGLTRPASVSAFPVQPENGTRRSYNEKRRDTASLSNRPYQSSYVKTTTSASK